ncbi:hypothetical protein AYO38_08495 [bacterium SCGC AG-212-C10]|nr:hypothetical protein AYO38_08495 [bacterium SCGC AG-212-C10]
MAIRPAPKRLLSLEEFLALPETEPASELIDGEVVQKPVRRIEESRALTELMFALSPHGGEPLISLGYCLPDDYRNHRVPDLSYFVPARALPDEGYAEEAPDLSAEVLAKGQARQYVSEKLTYMRGHGAGCTLLIDPQSRTIEVHDGARTFTVGAGEKMTLEALDGFSFAVDALFA